MGWPPATRMAYPRPACRKLSRQARTARLAATSCGQVRARRGRVGRGGRRWGDGARLACWWFARKAGLGSMLRLHVRVMSLACAPGTRRCSLAVARSVRSCFSCAAKPGPSGGAQRQSTRVGVQAASSPHASLARRNAGGLQRQDGRRPDQRLRLRARLDWCHGRWASRRVRRAVGLGARFRGRARKLAAWGAGASCNTLLKSSVGDWPVWSDKSRLNRTCHSQAMSCPTTCPTRLRVCLHMIFFPSAPFCVRRKRPESQRRQLRARHSTGACLGLQAAAPWTTRQAATVICTNVRKCGARQPLLRDDPTLKTDCLTSDLGPRPLHDEPASRP